ncbi:MAG: glycosyltransferase family A protein [Prevotellaceae bacterium]|nr:glycosyltransferase family A protein [Prevotellaceae bacterium]
MKEKYRFSVWTATYNRGHLMHNVYKCLCNQTFKDFEWIIIDDGSDDDTELICTHFRAEAPFPVTYIKKENGGKHTAWRLAINLFQGKYAVTLDSDDTLFPNALEIFDRHWKELENQVFYDDFWEVKGQVINQHGILLGGGFLKGNNIYDSDYNLLTYKEHFKSEMHACRKSSVLREFGIPPFIYEDRCNNFSEGILWSRIARKYKSRFINDVVRVYNQGTEGTLCKSSGNVKHFYNNIVRCVYLNKEQCDLMWKYEKRQYFLNLLILTYNSFRLGLSPFNKLYELRNVDKIIILLMIVPAAILKTIRK